MANVFDFELNADENATKALAEIEARLKALQPVLNSTREGLRFGGSETLENTGALGNKLRDMSQSAKDNVQNIGDMIPPLKNFGELFTKYSGISTMGLFGGVGGVIGGLTAGYKTLREMGREANNLDTLSKNTAMSIEDASKLTGALVQIGTEADQAKDSVQNLFNTLNTAERGENGSARTELDKLGVKIHTTKDGSADVIPTLLELEKAFKNKNIPSETENRLIVKLGLTPEILTLLREGKIQERLDKAKKYGQTRTEEENQKLTEFNTEANESAARFSGMWNRTKIDTATWLLDKGKEAEKKPAWQAIEDIRMRESDTADSFYHGNKEKDIRKRAISDKDFISQLTFMEEFRLLRGKPDEGVQKKLDDRYGESWEKQKKAHEAKAAANKIPALPKYEAPNYPNPLKSSGKKPRGIRNNNPLNIEFAKQKGATVEDHPERRFAKFNTPYEGLERTAWQLRRYFNGLTDKVQRQSVDLIVSKWAPPGKKDNNRTEEYIERVAKRLGVGRYDRLDLNNHNVMYALMREMGMVESKSFPYDKDLVMAAITSAPDPTKMLAKNDTSNIDPRVSSNNEKNTNEQEQQFPSLYGQNKQAERDEEISKRIARFVLEAIGDKAITVDINLTNEKTGERQQFQTKNAGKVTASMQYP
ncbi:hypothetical protein M5U04_17810 [Xenorhabdus sp. XENO-1]|uniref:hypothetical protein n=1 Tax=Xenorhabdus bovienii TaxID=40576 RepID=UPI0020CA3551|nr:hypothetical protein [Xenorhabdus bovienii]MCP9269885.1 hypothetical protein [Xenorhabdus bovienii subsp. africana]